MNKTIYLCILFCVPFVKGANILSLVCSTSRSHHILVNPLLLKLAERGHNVTVFTPFVDENLKVYNYHQIYLEGFLEEKEKIQFALHPNVSLINSVATRVSSYVNVSKKFWKNDHIQNLIKNKPKYDLVILEYTFAESYIALGYILNAPIVLFSTIPSNPLYDILIGNSLTPYYFMQRNETTSFFKRAISTLVPIVMGITQYYFINPTQEELVKKYVPGSPTLDDVKKNIALVLLNSHFAFSTPRPLVPNMISIGGFNLKEANQLPKELDQFLNESKSGAILFSFGSNVKITTINPLILKIILDSLGKLSPVRVVFKSEIELANVSTNIKVMKWLPQNDVLGHTNVKAFITHGGLGGTIEAIYHGVPMLGIPFFGDQESNLRQSTSEGIAIMLKYNEITEDSFNKAIHEILYNKRYRENALKKSILLKDQPIHPMDHAIFWLEHTIKHNGTEHLKNRGLNLRWYELYMVDVILFFTVVLLIIICLIFFTFKLLLKLLINICMAKKKLKKQ